MARGHILPPPHIPSRGPIVPPYELRYMLVPSGLVGNSGPYAQAQGPSQDLVYTPCASSGVGPTTGPFTSNDDNYDADQFIRDDDS